MKPAKILVAAVILYIITLSFLSVLKHEAYNSTAFDLGIFDQTVWGYSHFDNIFNTVRGIVLLGDHADPIIFLVVPFYWILPSANTLLIIQAVMIGLAALPLFFIGKKLMKSEAAALFVALAYLIYPTTLYINLFDFHPAALAIFPFMLATYALLEKKYLLMIISLSAAAMCKEHFALAMPMFGAYIFLFHKKRILGILTALLGGAWFAFNMLVFIPMFSSSYQHYTGYAYLLGGIWQLFTIGKLGYLALLAFPFAFGIFLAFGLEILLLALPFFGINLLRESTGITSVIYHHNAELLAFLFASASLGIARAAKWLKKPTALLSALVLVMCLIALAIYGPFTRLYGLGTFNMKNASGVKELAAMIPKNASVSASTWAVSHMSQREKIYMFPNPFYNSSYGEQYWITSFNNGSADYVLINTERKDPLMNESFQKETVSFIRGSGKYSEIAERGSWVLLKLK
jgi:uncharacterized membrane protein